MYLKRVDIVRDGRSFLRNYSVRLWPSQKTKTYRSTELAASTFSISDRKILGANRRRFPIQFAKDAFVCGRKEKMVFVEVKRVKPTQNVCRIGEQIKGFDVAYKGIRVGEA